MFDFTITQPSKSATLFCFLLYVTLVIVNWQKLDYSKNNNKRYVPLLLGIILYTVTQWIQGDWFHYQETVTSPITASDMEPFYLFLIELFDHNYLLFRIVVWGLAVVLVSRTYKRMSLDIKSGLFVLIAMYAVLFSYGRVSLGMAVFFFGYILLITSKEKQRKLIPIVIGIALMLLSISFHRSMIILVILSVATFVPLRKKSVFLYVVIAVAIFYIGSNYLNSFTASDFISDEELSQKLSGVDIENSKTRGRNFNGMITTVLKFATIYVPIVILSFPLFRKETRKVAPSSVYHLYIFVIFTMSYALAMRVAFLNDVYYYRTLYMCMIPICIVYTYLYQYGLLKKIEWLLPLLTGLLYNGMILALNSI